MKGFVFFGVLIFLCSGVFAASVTPSSYSMDFEPGFSGDFVFDFGFGPGVETDIYVSGDLAEYVNLDKEKLVGGGIVTATLNLPSALNLYGENRIRVGALEIAGESSGTGVVSDIRGLIKVNVPYPGSHVELELKAPNANAGEIVNLSVEIFNQGDEDTTVTSNIQIFGEGNLIENMELGEIDVPLMSSVIVESLFDSSGIAPGNYSAIFTGKYGPGIVVTAENPFRLGRLFVEIGNYTREFRENKYERFNIDVTSFYNYDIEELYAKVEVIEGGSADFVTPVGELRAWRGKTLEGFLDTSEIESEDFKAEITLYYLGETTSQVVELKLIMAPDYTLLFVLAGVALVTLFLVWRIVVFIKRTGKKSKKGKG